MSKRGTYILTNDLDKDVYLIKATSTYGEAKPYDGAVQISLPRRDVRCTDDPAKVSCYNGDTNWWYGEGTNHQLLEEGCIYREMPATPTWVIKVPCILDFVEEEGQCIVSIEDGRPSIEIYDGWRE